MSMSDLTEAYAPDLTDLADALEITEERKTVLDLQSKRLTIDHSLTLHRDSDSADDIRAMLDHLAAAGMPGAATVRIDHGVTKHTRIHARWSVEPEVTR